MQDQLDGDCGINSLLQEDIDRSFPWHVSLQKEEVVNSSVFKHFCGGSIISSGRVLTAAHCLRDPITKSNIDLQLTPVKVFAGTDNLGDSLGAREILVESFVIHPNFANTRHFDVALISLAELIEFDESVRPVCLPRGSSEMPGAQKRTAEEGMALSVAGWGSGDDAHAVLGNIIAVVYPNKFCSQAYSEEAARRIVPNLFTDTEDVLCGGDPMGAAGTCNGDSGKFIRKLQLVFNGN